MRRAMYFTWSICSNTIFSNSSGVRECLGLSIVVEFMASSPIHRCARSECLRGHLARDNATTLGGGGNDRSRRALRRCCFPAPSPSYPVVRVGGGTDRPAPHATELHRGGQIGRASCRE